MRFILFLTIGAGLFGQFVTILSSDTPAGSLTQLNKKMAAQVNAGVPSGVCTAGLDFALNSLTNGVYICPAGSWVLYAPAAGTVTNAMLAGSIDLTAKVTGVLPNANTTAATANTASAIVARDGSGNFVAGTVTAALTGNVTGNVTGTSGSATGNAGTSTALAANGANCSAGQFPLGVDASGAVETCTSLPTTVAGTANQITASASTGAITLSIPTSPTLPGTTTGTFSGNLTGNVTGNASGSSGSTTGNAVTATALAANPADCAANNFATTIAANGDLTCAQPSISAGVSGLAANVATALATPSSANLLAALTDETGTGAAVFGTSPAITTPAITGLPTGSGVASAATASTLMSRDANANASANSFIYGYATTATAAGTTTLTVSSANQQFFTGSTTQTVTLPVTSTMVLGQRYVIQNNSTGVVTVQSSGANTVTALPTLTSATFTVILTSGTTAASWSSNYVAAGGGGGSPGGSGTELQYRSGASTFGGLENSSRPNSGELRLGTTPAASADRAVFTVGTAAIAAGSANGNMLGINAPSGFGGEIIQAELNGVKVFGVHSNGNITMKAGSSFFTDIGSGGQVSNAGLIFSSASVVSTIRNHAGVANSDMRIIGTNGTTSSRFFALQGTGGGTPTDQLRINADQKAVMIGQTANTTSLSNTTLYLSDRTATTGVTRTMSEAGAGQSTTPMEEWRSYHATPGSGTLIMSIAGDAIPQWGTIAEPTCNSANRGKLVMVQGGAGVQDTFRICAKDAADAYAYRTIY